MPIDYEIETNHQQIAPIMAAYSEWCDAVTRVLCYPEQCANTAMPDLPARFGTWLDEQGQNDLLDRKMLETLSVLHDELIATTEQCVSQVSEDGSKIDMTAFDNFKTLYENFIQRLKVVEESLYTMDIGLDAQTRLRNRRVMLKQLNMELERRSRGGPPFCMTLARIDNFSAFKNELEEDELAEAIQKMAGVIKENLRSIDDAYRTQEGEFLFCMKQTDKPGCNAMINRIRKMVEDADISFKIGTRKIHMTMSYIVAEPIPGDTIQDLLSFMKDDMDRYATDSDTTLEYLEQTRLQRYLESAGEASNQIV